ADPERGQVAGQRLGLREGEQLEAVGGVALRFDRRVGIQRVIAPHLQREAPGNFERGLVEARESQAGIVRLELADEVPIAAFPLAEEPSAVPRGDRSAEAYLQARVPQADGLLE